METQFEIDPALRASLLEDGENIDDMELQRAMMEQFEASKRAQLEDQRYEELTGRRQCSSATPSVGARNGALTNSGASNHTASPFVPDNLTNSDDIQETAHRRSNNNNQSLSRETSKSPASRQSRSSSNAGSVSNRSGLISENDSCDDLDAADGPSSSHVAAAAAASDSDEEEIDEISEEKRRQRAICEEFYKYTSKPIAVTADDEKYMQIVDDFTKSNLTVVEVYRVYNSTTLENFEIEAEKLIRQNPELSENLNVQWLYHGSQAPLKELCDESLDIRFSRKGRFGKGIYFSDEPAKCVNYSAIDETRSRKYILYCRVILGYIKEYEPGKHDSKLIRPPMKDVVNNNTIYYNSVKGKPRDHTEFVIYDNHRAHIEYVIFYCNNSSIVPSPSKSRSRARSLDEESNTTETWLEQSRIITAARPSDRRKNPPSTGPLSLPASERPSANRRSTRGGRDESEQAGPSGSKGLSGRKQEKVRTLAIGKAADSNLPSVDFNDVLHTVATRQEDPKEELPPQAPPQSVLNAAPQEETSRPQRTLEQNARTAAISSTDEDATDGIQGAPQTQAGTTRAETSADEGMTLEAVLGDRDLTALMDVAMSEFMACTNIVEPDLAQGYVLRASLDSQKAIDVFYRENY